MLQEVIYVIYSYIHSTAHLNCLAFSLPEQWLQLFSSVKRTSVITKASFAWPFFLRESPISFNRSFFKVRQIHLELGFWVCVSGPAAGSTAGRQAGALVSSSKSVTQWSLSSWTACSPRHLLLWHPSRSSWPLETGPPCSRGGRGSSRRRSETDWGSGGIESQREEDFYTQLLKTHQKKTPHRYIYQSDKTKNLHCFLKVIFNRKKYIYIFLYFQHKI